MTDWEAIRESIQRAVEASEQFQEAGEELLNDYSLDEVRRFAAEMHALQDELARLLKILSQGSQVVSDDIAEVFTELVYRERMRYRTTSKAPPASGLPERGEPGT